MAIFLPALSTFYASYVGKQRHGHYVEPARIPAGFEEGIEGLNYLNPTQGYFQYRWSLYSAGHANLDIGFDAKEDMIRTRDENSWMLGDSGGFQIAKGVWEGDWRDPHSAEVQADLADRQLRKTEDRTVTSTDKLGQTKSRVITVDLVKEHHAQLAAAQKKRDQVLRWMDEYMNYGMTLDIPGWVCRTPRGRAATRISTYEEAISATKYNHEYWMKHRDGRCKLLNVLQGDTHSQADQWYDEMKKYCDPTQYPDTHFNGWAMGSQNKCDMHLVLRRLVIMIYDGLLETGVQDWVHYLGTSKLEWAMAFTQIQRAIRKYHNPNFTISYDCASPFLATANGQVYYENRLPDNGKWSYRMSKCVDDKKYASDTRLFRDALLTDLPKDWPDFIDSPVLQRTEMRDICHYAPGQVNKINKVGRTSWDSFSYAILMGHNIYCHIEAVQEGNRLYDAGTVPFMLRNNNNATVNQRNNNANAELSADLFSVTAPVPYQDTFFQDIVEAIFSAGSRTAALAEVDKHSGWYTSVIGSSANGMLGKKAINSTTAFGELFDLVDTEVLDLSTRDDSGQSEKALDNLEHLAANPTQIIKTKAKK